MMNEMHNSATCTNKSGISVIANTLKDKADKSGHHDKYITVPPALVKEAQLELKSWPMYEPTPLLSLPALANELNVKEVLIKDESKRKPLNNFKTIAGPFAILKYLKNVIGSRTGELNIGFEQLCNGEFDSITKDICVSCATDGNHGMSVAWGAKTFGISCVIYVPISAEPSRCKAIEQLGATLIRVNDNYDAAVRRAQSDAERYGRQIISDTSYPGYEEIPLWIMAAYSVLCDEFNSQVENYNPPTHYFAQVGCGGLATAVAEQLIETMPEHKSMITVEPVTAGCLYESIIKGQPSVVGGDHHTAMKGLACGEVSSVSWQSLSSRVDYCMMIDDIYVDNAYKLINSLSQNSQELDIGPTGISGIAGLAAAATTTELRDVLNIDNNSSLFSIITEGHAR